MLKNSKVKYNWIFQIIIGYYNRIFLISVALSLVFFVFVCFLFGVRDYRRMIFSESSTVHMGYNRTRIRHSEHMLTQFIDS